MTKKITVIAVTATLVAISVLFYRHSHRHTVTIGTNTVQVDVSDTPALREQGLSGRASLCADCGMLFTFDTPSLYGFWMKDMNFPLDIVWISAQKKIIWVENSLSPTTYPTVFYPKEPALYVLELPAGYVLERHIDIGAEVNFSL